MFSSNILFWALLILLLINMLRYFSSVRALLFILRQFDPLLYHSVNGNGFFTLTGPLTKQLRLVSYINHRLYYDHHHPDVVLRCERIRKQFILMSRLSIFILVSQIYRFITA